MESAEAMTRELARRLRGILGTDTKASYVRSLLLEISPSMAADMLAITVAYVEARDASHGELLQTFSLALASPSCWDLRVEMREILEARGELGLANMVDPEAGQPQADDKAAVPDFGVGRPLTLGERKSLARRPDRETLMRILRDPHPDVIRIALGCPGIIEEDVVHLAARRPVPTESLREIFRSSRWIVRYRVKTALALNPHTPLDVSLQLVPLLKDQDRRRVARSADLSLLLREASQRRPRSDIH